MSHGWGWEWGSVVEHLRSTSEALSSIPSMENNKNKNKQSWFIQQDN